MEYCEGAIDIEKCKTSWTTDQELKEYLIFDVVIESLQSVTQYFYNHPNLFDDNIINSYEKLVKGIKRKQRDEIEQEMDYLLGNINYEKCVYQLRFNELFEFNKIIKDMSLCGTMVCVLSGLSELK